MAATTIGFAEKTHPPDEKTDQVFTSTAVDDSIYTRPFRRTITDKSSNSEENRDGIYNMRDITRTLSRSHSKPRDESWNWKHGARDPEDDDPGLQRAGDYRQKEVFHGRLLIWLSYQSVGAIYGDIGTSPLYVYSSTFKAPPSHEDLVGVLSIIIWTLTMMVTVKYVLIILRADNNGEGGTFSTYSLLSRYLNITNRDPREASLVQLKRFSTGDLERTGGRLRRGIEHSAFARGLLKTIGVLAVSMVMSDGVLTPAQSVLGAVQGLNVVVPDITKSAVIGTTAGILIILFLIQPFGTSKLATSFAPIVIIWLLFNACFGVFNLARHDHSVLVAFDPVHAFQYLIRHKTDGWRSLGGVLLAFTGVEALFADLGAFSMRAIQISWLGFTFPCLLLAYIGQAAFISQHPEAYSNPFFNSVPPGWVIPSLISAILAAVVASQAIITATFQLLAQIMKLSYFPQVKVVHTSKIFHGQLYVPIVNWLLMVGTIVVAAIYNNTTSLGNAYGVCVMFVTFFDTCMVSLAAMFVWRISPYLVFLLWLTIACLDGVYLSSALTKVPDGAWFTLTLSGCLTALFILWRFGKEQQWAAEAADRFPTTHFVRKQADGTIKLTPNFGGNPVGTIQGLGIFFDKSGMTTPPVFSQFLVKLAAAPSVIVFFHLRSLEVPSVPVEDRYSVSRLALPNCYRVVVRHGFNDVIINPDLAFIIRDRIADFILHNMEGRPPVTMISGNGTEQRQEGDENMKTEPNQPTVSTADVDQGGDDAKLDSSDSSSYPDDPAQEQQQQQRQHITFQKPHSLANAANAATAATGTTTNHNANPVPRSSRSPASSALAALEAAYNHQVLYIIGKSQLKVAPHNALGGIYSYKGGFASLFRRGILHVFLWLRENTRTKIASLNVSAESVFEVGFIRDI